MDRGRRIGRRSAGRWIAYESNETGQQPDIFVRPFPAVDSGKWQVTSGGGSRPMWARNGRELFYLSTVDGSRKLFAVPVPAHPAGSGFTYGKPQQVFSMANYLPGATRAYDISPDGRRFLVVKEAPDAAPPSQITIVSHWFDELRARVKAK